MTIALTEHELQFALRHLDQLNPVQKAQVLSLLEERDKLARYEDARQHFLSFVKMVWPDFIPGAHHQIMAEAFEDVAAGKCDRLIINLPPRHTKSELASWLLPAWFLGKFPRKKIIQASNTEALAAGFGRRVRNLIAGEDLSDGSDEDFDGHSAYENIFPGVRLAADSKAAAGWHTNRGGEYFAIGVNGKVTGKGGDIVIIDDPHALATDTEIPTPQGFRMLKDLQVGDMVFGPDGEPTRVVAKSPVYEGRELYRVTTNDGASVYADAAHLWNYRSDTKVTAPFVTGRTDELSRWKKVSAPVLPTVSPVRYVQRKLPIDPYLLGVWLGNGTATLGRITSHLDDVAWFREQFDRGGYETTDQADPHNFGVIGLRAELIAAGLFDNKHIPEGYLSASYEQRLALLQGLMDTDGHVMNSGTCNFDNTNASLVEGVCELVRSFGVRAIIKHFHKADGVKSDCYRVNFSLPEACRLPRKRAKLKSVYTKRGRSITVTPTGVHGRVQCITVERPDGLFLAGRGYIVTHNSEQEAKQAETNPAIFDDVYAWYNAGPRQRLQPGGTIILVMTRWSKRDLTGKVLAKQAAEKDNPDTDKWRVISFPAILDENTPTERSTWPGFWPLPTLRATRSVLPVSSWSAQYQQNPTSEGAAILKREYWRRWGDDDKEKCPGPQHVAAWQNGDPPACEYIIGSWDCAATANERSHPSAYTLWGVFKAEDPESGKTLNHIILLQAYKARMEFPELKRTAKQFYDEDRPDTLLIENKSAGMQLLQEFRSMGVPAESFTGSSRGSRAVSNDKIARANMIADVFASRYVWCPPTRFADEVMEQCASFPAGEEDDLVDSTVQAMMRFREGGFIRTANDEAEDAAPVRFRRKRYY